MGAGYIVRAYGRHGKRERESVTKDRYPVQCYVCRGLPVSDILIGVKGSAGEQRSHREERHCSKRGLTKVNAIDALPGARMQLRSKQGRERQVQFAGFDSLLGSTCIAPRPLSGL